MTRPTVERDSRKMKNEKPKSKNACYDEAISLTCGSTSNLVRMPLLLFLFVFVVCIAMASPAAAQNPPTRYSYVRNEHHSYGSMHGGGSTFDKRKRQTIVNGWTVNDLEKKRYQFTTSIQYGSEHLCGGSLIAPDIVLSAAHCFQERVENEDGHDVLATRNIDILRATVGEVSFLSFTFLGLYGICEAQVDAVCIFKFNNNHSLAQSSCNAVPPSI